MAEFEFSPEKALATTGFLAQQSGETMYTILKMVYVADRMHLERYGRPITGDSFFALPEGACPTKIYDSMKALRGDGCVNYLPGSKELLRVDANTHDVEITAMPDMGELSASDVECLEETISILKKRGRWHIRDMAHDVVWKNTARNSAMSFMEIAKSLDGGEVLSQHLANRF
jgi:uncharacterized phage-associated protein